jgi:ABC-type nitrate/sulfonate/bicarbonate transport system substrate-binding protein
VSVKDPTMTMINRRGMTRRSLLPVAAAVIAAPQLLVPAARAGIDPDAARYEVSELRYQGWTSEVLFPELAEDLGYLAPLKLRWVGNTTSGPQDIQSSATGDTDFGGAFNGSIVKLIAAGAPIKAVVAQYGCDKETYTGLYVLADSPVRAARDLIGRKVGMNTLGAYHEYLLTDYLIKAGLGEEDIKQVTMIAGPPVNLAQMLRQKQTDATFLFDIVLDKALERGGLRALMTDFGTYGPLSLGGYVLTDRFISEKPNAARKFVEAVAKAIEWARLTPRDAVVARMQKIAEARGRNEDPTVVRYWKSIGIAGKGGVMTDQEFAVYIDWYIKTGLLQQGQVKVVDAFTNKFNPFRDIAAQ